MRRDGKAPVFLQYCYSATNLILLNTGICIPPRYWNIKQLCISNKLPYSYGDHEKVNEELIRLKRVAEDLVTHAIKKGVPGRGNFVKKSFSPALQVSPGDDRAIVAIKQKAAKQKNKLDIYCQVDDYIKSKERKVNNATLAYTITSKHTCLLLKLTRERK